ncbi:MAG: Gfo/Idh/MocA family protein [Spirochaetota bacterium]
MTTEVRHQVRCAVVGLGRIGSLLEDDGLREKPCTHTGAIVSEPSCRLVAGCDLSESRRELFRNRWECDEVFADAEQMLEHTQPEVLCIATPPDTHWHLVQTAERRGVSVAVCEKPLAYTLRDAKRIARLHRSGNTRVITNHERRYSADYLAVRSLIRRREYGRLLSIRGTLYFGGGRHDQVLLHDGTHMVDIINYLVGANARFSRRFGKMRSRASSAYIFGRVGSVPIVIEVGSERDHLVFELELSFERGRVRLGNGVLSFERSEQSPYYENYRSLLQGQAPEIAVTGYFTNMIRDAVKAVGDPVYEPVSTALDGLAVMKFIKSVRGYL